MRKTAVMALIAFLINFIDLPAASAAHSWTPRPPAAKADGAAVARPVSRLIGNAYPEGEARVYLAGQWLRLRGTCPVASGEVFSTARGKISFVFDDGTRVDAGADSAVAFGAGYGPSYDVVLIKGRIGINGSGSSRFKLLTPDNLRLVPGRAGFIGGISFEGGRTMVKTLSGGLIAQKGKARYASLDGALAAKMQGGASDSGAEGGAGGGAGAFGSTTAAFAIGGAMVAGTITGVTLEQNRRSHGWNEASPYLP